MEEIVEEPEIKVGDVLFASSELDGTLFENRLILIVNSNHEDGCFGFILNDPARLPLREVFSPLPSGCVKQFRQFYMGGPVDEDELFMLERVSSVDTMGGEKIAEGVCFGGHWSEVSDLVDADEGRVLLFLGYAGWSCGQLEEEVKEGSWSYYQGLRVYDLLGLLVHGRILERQKIEDILGQCK